MFQESHLTKHNLIEPCLNKLVNQLRSGDVEEPQEPEVSFDYQELQTLFADKGLDALLAKLKELKAAGLIESIKVSTDVDTGKTTVSFEYDGIEYEFTGTTGEAASGDDENNQADSGHRDVVDTLLNKFEEFFKQYNEQYHLIDNGEHTEPGNNIDAETAQDVGNNNTPDIDTRDGAFDFSGINMTPEVQTTDDIYAALEPLKEQMHAYVKKQLEAAGLTYNQEIVEKQLNVIISRIVDSQVSSDSRLIRLDSDPSVRPQEFNLQASIELILLLIDQTINKDIARENTSSYIFRFDTRGYDSFVNDGLEPDADNKLLNTADYFLTEEEKQLKELMEQKNSLTKNITGTKEELSAQLDIFALHTKNYLKSQYNLSDTEIAEIIEKAKIQTLNQAEESIYIKIIGQINNEDMYLLSISDFTLCCDRLAVQQCLNNDPSIAQKAADSIANIDIQQILENLDSSTIHTEFAIVGDGRLVFENEKAQNAYSFIAIEFEGCLRSAGLYELLGANNADIIDSLVRTAWISTYNEFNSSQKNDTESFIRAVVNNLNKILDKLASNPEYLEVFTKNPAYGDEDLNEQLYKYYGDGKLNYKNNQLASNANYNTTMDAALNLLIQKYPTIDSAVITDIFAKAKQEAIDICNNDIKDCPYGTGKGSAYISDGSVNWKKNNDSRDGDGYKIEMEQLVQLTLYCFDKLFYQWLSA